VTGPALRLLPVGTGAAFGRPGEGQSCHLVQAGDRYLVLDLGSGSLSRLVGIVPPERLALVAISHLHPDHCVDLLALRVYMAWGPGQGRVLPVLGPPGLRERLVAFSGSEGWDHFDFQEWPAGAGERDLGDGLVLRHREVPHLPPTNAIRLERGGASLCYGADCGPNEALPELARGCDLLVCEATLGPGPRPADVPHLTVGEAGAIAARAGAGRLLLVHCEPQHDRAAVLDAARAEFAGPADWAVEGEPWEL
jgi:ribonuclease BN (tRNA processing enzyme)